MSLHSSQIDVYHHAPTGNLATFVVAPLVQANPAGGSGWKSLGISV